jgi:hypothetical protein
MRRILGVGIAGLVVLVAVPAIAVAMGAVKPHAGKWKITVSGPSSNPKGSFTISSDRTQLKSFTLRLVSSEGDAYGDCSTPPSGKFTLPTLKLKKSGDAWGYGIAGSGGSPPPKTGAGAKLNGARLAGVSLYIEFDGTNQGDSHIYIKTTGDSYCYYDLVLKP